MKLHLEFGNGPARNKLKRLLSAVLMMVTSQETDASCCQVHFDPAVQRVMEMTPEDWEEIAVEIVSELTCDGNVFLNLQIRRDELLRFVSRDNSSSLVV